MSTSNSEQVFRNIGGFLRSFNFTRVGSDQSLGRDVAHKEVDQIEGRCSRQVGPDGEPWDKNTDSTMEGKEVLGWGDNTPNVATNNMLNKIALFGETRVEPYRVTLVYGTNAKASKSYSPSGKLRKSDEKLTDREKAYFAHTGQGPHATERPFYGFGEGDRAAIIDDVLQPALNEAIREHNAS
jgi:hypothetical protein